MLSTAIASPRYLFLIYLLQVLHFVGVCTCFASLFIYLFITTILHALAIISHPTRDWEWMAISGRVCTACILEKDDKQRTGVLTGNKSTRTSSILHFSDRSLDPFVGNIRKHQQICRDTRAASILGADPALPVRRARSRLIASRPSESVILLYTR